MNKNSIYYVVGAIVVAGGIFYYFKNQQLKKKYEVTDNSEVKLQDFNALINNPVLK